ncbi:unnamed protein product [Parajaminaea phylloscopi]
MSRTRCGGGGGHEPKRACVQASHSSQDRAAIGGTEQGLLLFPSVTKAASIGLIARTMQSPVEEIPGVVKALVEAKNADDQLLALRRYYSPDASFDHMLCAVPQGPQSRDNGIAPVYQWLRMLSNSTIRIDSVAFDQKKNKAYVDAAQTLRPNVFPVSLWTPTLRILVVLQLHKGADGLFYVNRQEDYYTPHVLPGHLVPGGYTVLLTIKFLAAIACIFMAWFIQTFLGYWKPSKKALQGGKSSAAKRVRQ